MVKETKSVGEQYWKISLIILIIVLGGILFKESLLFLSGILGAFTIYIMVRKQMIYLSEQKKIKKSIAALLILGEVILCFLVPAFLTIWLILSKIQSIDLAPNSIITTVQHLIALIQERTGYDVLSHENLSAATSSLTKILQKVLGEISSFVINSIVLLFVLYFMLTGNRQMEQYIYDILPFKKANKKNILHEVKIMVRSNAIGVPLLALIQGTIAMIGYFIFGTPDPIVFGFLTCFATIIPLIGTSLIWFPLAAYLALTGNWGGAIGLAIYALVVISNVDNLIRFILQKQLADTHPLITVFGVVIGLTLFGFWGVIFGPLLMSMFLLLLNMFKKEYLDKIEE